MAINLASISKGKARRAPRIVLLGVEKVGKSTFASQAPGPVFIPVKGEQGLDELDCSKFPVAGSFGDVLECLTSLATEEHGFRTVVIDSASTLEPLVWEKTCQDNGGAASIERVGGGYGKGYVEALKQWRELQAALDYLRDERDMGVVLIGHVKVKTFNDPLVDPYDQYQFDIQDKAANLWYRWADSILFANFKTFTKTVAESMAGKKTVHAVAASQKPEPVLYTQKRPAHPGGGRVTLPYELPLNWPAFEAALKAARDATDANAT
jgi:hypothetical protein